jgi:hypothetical protein
VSEVRKATLGAATKLHPGRVEQFIEDHLVNATHNDLVRVF